MKIPRELDPAELRVLGALLEKEQTTPEYYPLSLNALVAACNQRSNRDPVMTLTEADVRAALDRLHDDVLVWPVQGARVDRWRHNIDRRWETQPETKALMTLLMLRGPQTPGELRGRGSRMHPFADTSDVEAALDLLAAGPEPLVAQCERCPGQKETRWMHLLAGPVEPETPAETRVETRPERPERLAQATPTGAESRIGALEARVEQLERQLRELATRLGEEL